MWMDKVATSYPNTEGWEPQDKPRCKACGGETVQVLAQYGIAKPQLEWECMLCSKSFKVDGKVNHQDKKKYKKRYTHKPRKQYRRN
jgi:ribosomal protein L37AE/L43A